VVCNGEFISLFIEIPDMSHSTGLAAKDIFKVGDNFQSSHDIYALAETPHLLANARVHPPVFWIQEGM
jgi:hypothetical protein